MDRPRPGDYQPPLSAAMHAWRLVAMIALSTVFWSLVYDGQRADMPLFWLDVGVGLASYVLVHLRRRAPLRIALLLNAMAVFSGLASGPAILAAVSCATRRVGREIAILAILICTASSLFYLFQPVPHTRWWIIAVANLVFATLQLGWGMYLGSRRELYYELSRRAEQAEAERDERAERAREHERARIAREMHDVVAHRISQISLHAGAMIFREDLDVAALRNGVNAIQQNANHALTELRGVLGVLRDLDTGELRDHPQPTYADLPHLIRSSRAAGVRIDFDDELAVDAQEVPAAMGRTIFRVVQEGITNAAKHAAGTIVTVWIDGDREHGITVTLSNPLGFGRANTTGGGLGLIGLVERVELGGGALHHERTGSHFQLQAWIPWPP